MEWTTKMEGGGSLYIRDDGPFLYLEANRHLEPGIFKVILQGMGGGQLLGTLEPTENGLKLSRMVSRQTMAQWGCLPLSKVLCQRTYPTPPVKKTPLSAEDVLSPGLIEGISAVLGEISPRFTETSRVGGENIGENKAVAEERGAVSEEKPEEPFAQGEIQWIAVPEVAERGFLPCFDAEQRIADPLLARGVSGRQGILRQENQDGFSLAIPYFPDKAFPLTALFCLGKKECLVGGDYIVYSFSKEGRPLDLPGSV